MGDVRNPRPHDICMVNNTIGKRSFSLIDFPVISEATIKNIPYVAAGIINIGLSINANTIESAVPANAKGGAK